jgi:HEAT repeat protein/peroxiredoxin
MVVALLGLILICGTIDGVHAQVPGTAAFEAASPKQQYQEFINLGQRAGFAARFSDEQLVQQAGSKDLRQSAAAFWTLQSRGRRAADAAPGLVTLLRTSPEKYVQIAAIHTLGKVGVTTEAAEAIIERMEEFNSGVEQAGSLVLQNIAPEDAAVAPTLGNALVSSKSSRVSYDAAMALKNLGEGALPALPSITEYLTQASVQKTTPMIINVLGEVLFNLGKAGAPAAPVIVKNLLPGGSFTEKGVIRYDFAAPLLVALTRIGVPQTALPIIESGLQSQDPRLFAASARAAGILGASQVVPLLKRSLIREEGIGDLMLDRRLQGSCAFSAFSHNMSTSVALETIHALGKIGPAAKEAAPLLTQFAQLPDAKGYRAELAIASREALERMGVSEAVFVSLPARSSARLASDKQVTLGKTYSSSLVLKDLKGMPVILGDKQRKPVALVFVDTQCPCVTAYDDRMKSLQKRYASKGLEVVYVFSSRTDTRKSVTEFAKQQKYPWRIVFDEKQQIAKQFNVRVTTETYLFDQAGTLRYHGRIDDSVFEPEYVKERNLEVAVKAVLGRLAVKKAETKAIGCSLWPQVATR